MRVRSLCAVLLMCSLARSDDGSHTPWLNVDLVPDRLRLGFVSDSASFEGLDISVRSWTKDFRGVAVGASLHAEDHARGLQLGLQTYSGDGKFLMQAGFINQTQSGSSLQLGLINIANHSNVPVQVGLTNWTRADKNPGLALSAINLGPNHRGLQLGIANYYASESSAGASLALLLNHAQDYHGLQVSPINLAQQRLRGVQIGAYNYASKLKGLQLGVINYALEISKGVQLGLMNIYLIASESGENVHRVSPLLRVMF